MPNSIEVLRKQLIKVKNMAEEVKAAPFHKRSEKAEAALMNALYLVKGMIDKLEQLESDEIPFGGADHGE